MVRAVDPSNGVEDPNLVEISGVPCGQPDHRHVDRRRRRHAAGADVLDSRWSIDATEGNIGPNVYKTGELRQQPLQSR